jgi:hypothetical protein
MGVTELLSRLAGVKKTGAGTWVARCPSHTDRSPSLSLREADDRVLLHCFAGCDTGDILAAVGLTFADVMPERVDHHRPRMRPAFPPADVLEILGHDVTLAGFVMADVLDGKREFTQADMAAMVLAVDRCAKAAEYARGR